MGNLVAGRANKYAIFVISLASPTFELDMMDAQAKKIRGTPAVLAYSTMFLKKVLPDFLFDALFSGLFI
jgi:hypothetical protein